MTGIEAGRGTSTNSGAAKGNLATADGSLNSLVNPEKLSTRLIWDGQEMESESEWMNEGLRVEDAERKRKIEGEG